MSDDVDWKPQSNGYINKVLMFPKWTSSCLSSIRLTLLWNLRANHTFYFFHVIGWATTRNILVKHCPLVVIVWVHFAEVNKKKNNNKKALYFSVTVTCKIHYEILPRP